HLASRALVTRCLGARLALKAGMTAKLGSVLVQCLFVGASTVAVAQPYDDEDYDDTADSDASIYGEPVPSVDVFYDQLSSYGVWLDDPEFGRVFTPDDPGFV